MIRLVAIGTVSIVVGFGDPPRPQTDDQPGDVHAVLEGDPRIQAMLKNLRFEAADRMHQIRADDTSAYELSIRVGLAEIQHEVSNNHLLFQQLLYLNHFAEYVDHTPDDDDIDTAMFGLMLRRAIRMRFEDRIDAVLPFVESSHTDSRLAADDVLESIATSHFEQFLLDYIRRTGDLHKPLVRYLYRGRQSGAIKAVLSAVERFDGDPLMNAMVTETAREDIYLLNHYIDFFNWRRPADGREEARRKEEGIEPRDDVLMEIDLDDVIADVKQLLDRLSQHSHWWIRLYVVEVIQKYSKFYDDDVVRRLTNDEDTFVRECALEIGTPAPPQQQGENQQQADEHDVG